MNTAIIGVISVLMVYAVFGDDIHALPKKHKKRNTQELFCTVCDKKKKFIIVKAHVYECPTCSEVLDLS